MVAIIAEQLPGDPAPKAGVSVTGLGIGVSLVNVWRIADGQRQPVRGARRITMNDASFVTDWDVPTNRPVQYEVEVLSGPNGAARATAEALVVEASSSWLMDPFVPQTAMPILGERKQNGDVYLRGPALSALEYGAETSIFNIMGDHEPVGLFGERMAERSLDLSMGTRSAEENKRLKNLLLSTSSFLFRPGPELAGVELKGSMFIVNPVAVQVPIDTLWGGEITWWDFKADTVKAPTIKVLTATFTYGDVKIMFTTYGQKQEAMAGKTYLDDLKNPLG